MIQTNINTKVTYLMLYGNTRLFDNTFIAIHKSVGVITINPIGNKTKNAVNAVKPFDTNTNAVNLIDNNLYFAEIAVYLIDNIFKLKHICRNCR